MKKSKKGRRKKKNFFFGKLFHSHFISSNLWSISSNTLMLIYLRGPIKITLTIKTKNDDNKSPNE